MKNKWNFKYDEEVLCDEYAFEFIGILTNGEDFLFYEIYPDENMTEAQMCVYSSILRNTDTMEISFPDTPENRQKMLDALNSLSDEERCRYCGENAVFNNPDIWN